MLEKEEGREEERKKERRMNRENVIEEQKSETEKVF